MNALRIIAAIVVGYVLFALGSMFLVGPVMAKEGTVIIVLGLIGLALVGLFSGLIARAIAGEKAQVAGYVLAALVGLATLANLLMQLGAEPVWYKVGTLLLTMPLILVVCLRPPK